MTGPGERWSSRWKWCVRLFAGAVALSIAIETFPRQYGIANPLKSAIAPVTNRIGLWQGEWPLFAPNPVLNNAWISAELRGPDGSMIMWNSPYWATKSGWEKFRNFRMLNYCNRIAYRENCAKQDLADYLLRNEFALQLRPVVVNSEAPSPDEVASHSFVPANASSSSSHWRMDIVRSQLNISMPSDGSLPTRDETTWISSSRHILTREYEP